MVEADGVSILLYRLEPGRRFERHQHPFPELGVVLAGRGRALIGDEVRMLREADSYYFPADLPHAFEVDGDGPVVLMGVTIPLPPDVPGPAASDVVKLARELARTPLDSCPADG
jgi:quercetin dioxygenase-like cupin family protein